jgi:hypothetical protein
MSDLKFSCPSCGQHIQCEESHIGENIPCPGCAILIRVPANAAIVTNSAAPIVTPSSTPAAIPGIETVPTLEENFQSDPGTPIPSAPPLTEREQQIAAARAARPVVPTPAVKPRLSFILSGGEAPAPQENESALNCGEHKHPENSNQKTVHE